MRKILAKIFLLCIMLAAMAVAQSAYGPPIENTAYEISRSKVEREITHGQIFRDTIRITNFLDRQIRVTLNPTTELLGVLSFESTGGIITPKNFTDFQFTLTGKEIKEYNGEIAISEDINEKIQVNLTVKNQTEKLNFFIAIQPTKKTFTFKENLDFNIDIQKILDKDIKNISFAYTLIDSENNTYPLGTEKKDLLGSLQIRKRPQMPPELKDGFYILETTAEYKNQTTTATAEVRLKTPFWSILLFGFLPIWVLALIVASLILLITSAIVMRRAIEKRKKYKMQLYTKTLPKKNEKSLWLGKVAEAKRSAYLDMDALTTHGVVAGATGGGKSISAQVIIEEALLKNIAVIVFDPTAQWSGMLRKCEDKKMLSFYSKFGLKPEDAKAFPGNLRQIQNERQAIDIKKYMNPGQIQIFTMNKLTPPQIDTFVASVIASIFKSDPKEHPGLRVLLVFDEVHRLLPKFGGSGKGFLQIERACREFRKWGFGVMLVSQVLSDFVGEIKANINTEVQMRTRDEADLNRLKTKYGEEFLQSLIKASVGVGMFVNPKYNKGKPYFINFRPILHSTRRLSDKILEQYNKYSEIIEDIEFQIEQLEQEKVDTFDLKMELKLVKDKLMSGNFTVVDIYLEGLKPRLEKQWSSIGKKPKKREIELVDTTEIESSLKQAEKGRAEFEKTVKGAAPKTNNQKEDKDKKPEEAPEEKSETQKQEENSSENKEKTK